MIDLVQANEFTFTPSAFIAAFIKTDTITGVRETVSGNSGALTTRPVYNPTNSFNSSMKVVTSGNQRTVDINGVLAGGLGKNQIFKSSLAETPGGNLSSESPIKIQGSIAEFLGSEIRDTRASTKLTTTTVESLNTVVLILSYGTFESKCINPQNTINAIYSGVAAYFNSL